MEIPSIEESNQAILDLIETNRPFIIGRLASGITKVAITYDYNKTIDRRSALIADTNEGLYTNNDDDIILYCLIYLSSIKSSILACFPSLFTSDQEYFVTKYNLNKIHNRGLEPYYILNENPTATPWTHALKGKKVLIISSFVESFKSQIGNDFNFYGKDDPRRIWDKDQEFVYYKTFNCLSGSRPHKNWFETYTIMCNEIKCLEFDIALVSCGGYSMPLCGFVYNMGKSAIYVGGGLQLLFGVYGERWLNHDIIKSNINSDWVRPSDNERPRGYEKIENGCYW